MALLNKIKWVLSILLVFFLVVATNLVDKDNFRRIKDSIVTIYEDRIVANDLIFNFLLLTHEKEMAVALSDTIFFKERNIQVNEEIQLLTAKYLTTKLTAREAIVFDALQNDFDKLVEMEKSINKNTDAYKRLLSGIKEKLTELSGIQLQEGGNLMTISKETYKDVELFTQIEIYFLIFLAILVQIIIFYKPKIS